MLPNVAYKVTLLPSSQKVYDPPPSVSVAHLQFGEDPVTQIADLSVIKDTPLVCTSKTTN